MKYRKLPVEVEAIQFTLDNIEKLSNFIQTKYELGETDDGLPLLFICTLEGDMVAKEGDWIIKGVKGEFYPCKPDIFAETYEPVEKCVYDKFIDGDNMTIEEWEEFRDLVNRQVDSMRLAVDLGKIFNHG